MWAHAFRDSVYYAAVDTNNGTEALNKALKYSYLPKRKSLTLSGIASLLIDRFLPDMWQKYVFQNYKLSTEYRAYSMDIPAYLQGRPRSVILHCLQRKAKCHKFTAEDIKKIDDDGIFEVYKTGGGKHRVNFSTPECTCKDWIRHHIPCKHFFAIFEQCPGWDWSKLPQHFLGSSYLSADTNSVHKYLNIEETENGDQPSDFHCEDLSLPQLPKQKVHVRIGCYITLSCILYMHMNSRNLHWRKS